MYEALYFGIMSKSAYFGLIPEGQPRTLAMVADDLFLQGHCRGNNERTRTRIPRLPRRILRAYRQYSCCKTSFARSMEAKKVKEQLLSRLDKVRGNGTKYRAKCPARDHSSGDNTLSLLFNSDGRILIHCHAGCEVNDVLESIGLSLSDLYPDGAIRDFMASAQQKPKQHKYDAWLELCDQQRKAGVKLSRETLELEKQMYLRKRQR